MTKTGIVRHPDSKVKRPICQTCLLPASRDGSNRMGASCMILSHLFSMRSLAPIEFASYATRTTSLSRIRMLSTPSGHTPSAIIAAFPVQVRSMLEPCVDTCSHLNSVVRVRCLITSSTVAVLPAISNSARARMRLVRSCLTYGNVASVRCSFVSQPVHVMPDTLRMTCSLSEPAFSISIISDLLGCTSSVLILVSVFFSLEQQPILLAVSAQQPASSFCETGRRAALSFAVGWGYSVTDVVQQPSEVDASVTTDGSRFPQQLSASVLFEHCLETDGVDFGTFEERRDPD
jgi:hypothetical protein